MANLKGKITETAIAKLPAGDELYDTEIPGFHVRKNGDGTSTYKLYYRTRQAQQRRPKLGQVGVLSLPDARAKAKSWLGQVADGGDPGLAIQLDREVPTMTALWKIVLADHYTGLSCMKDVMGQWESWIEPALGSVLVRDVDYALLKKLHDSMAHVPVRANRVMATISTMMKEAMRLKWIAASPTTLVKRYPENKERGMALGGEEELIGTEETETEAVRLWKALEAQRRAVLQTPSGGVYYSPGRVGVAFIKVCCFTGMRPKEAATARKEWFVSEDVLVIPKDHHKTGWKTGKPRVVIFPRQALDIIRTEVPDPGDGTLFGIQSPKDVWETVRAAARLNPKFRFYDCRHNFVTIGINEAAFSPAQIGNLAGHKLKGDESAEVTARYNHKRYGTMRFIAQEVADQLEAMFLGLPAPTLKQAGTVVPFQRRAA